MTPAERGKRIKEARIAKKMTQSEVVGNFITRNMLSQIESGVATPSVKTLEYLADVLDIPVASLMPGDENDGFAVVSPILNKLLDGKTYYLNKDYESAVDCLGEPQNADMLRDEYEAILALSYLGLAKQNAGLENAAKAVEYAKLSSGYAEKGLYANPAVKSEAVRLINRLAQELSKYYTELISEN